MSHFRNLNAYNSVIYERKHKVWVFIFLERKEQCGTKIICVFKNFWFLHFHRLPCELENARVLYKIKRKFAFFSVRTHENSDVFNSRDEIYLVFTEKKQISSIYSLRYKKIPGPSEKGYQTCHIYEFGRPAFVEKIASRTASGYMLVYDHSIYVFFFCASI